MRGEHAALYFVCYFTFSIAFYTTHYYMLLAACRPHIRRGLRNRSAYEGVGGNVECAGVVHATDIDGLLVTYGSA